MGSFENCIGFTLKHEGYKSNDVHDLGGLTIFGISHKYHPKEVEEMDKLPYDKAMEIAKEIYYNEYWLPSNCVNYYDKVALAIFDSAVNCGVPTVKAWVDDISKNFNGNPVILTVHDILYKRLQLYVDICTRNCTQREFLLGWTQRVLDLANWGKNGSSGY